jgi:hypothetical protein
VVLLGRSGVPWLQGQPTKLLPIYYVPPNPKIWSAKSAQVGLDLISSPEKSGQVSQNSKKWSKIMTRPKLTGFFLLNSALRIHSNVFLKLNILDM